MLAWAQQRPRLALPDADLADQGVLNRGAEEGSSRGDLGDRAAELVSRGVAQDASAGAEDEQLVSRAATEAWRDEEHSGRQPLRRGQRQQAGAAQRGQCRIDERHVRAGIAQKGKRFARVASLARELPLGPLADDAAQRVAEQRLPLDDGDAGQRGTAVR